MTSYAERIEAHEQGEHQDEYVGNCEHCLDEALSRQPLPRPAPEPEPLPVCPTRGCKETDWRFWEQDVCIREATLSAGGGLEYFDSEWQRLESEDKEEHWWECAAGHVLKDIPLIAHLNSLKEE